MTMLKRTGGCFSDRLGNLTNGKTTCRSGTVVFMPGYRLRFLDPSGKFIRGDRIEGDSDGQAVAIASERRLPVRSELWKGPRLVAKLPPA